MPTLGPGAQSSGLQRQSPLKGGWNSPPGLRFCSARLMEFNEIPPQQTWGPGAQSSGLQRQSPLKGGWNSPKGFVCVAHASAWRRSVTESICQTASAWRHAVTGSIASHSSTTGRAGGPSCRGLRSVHSSAASLCPPQLLGGKWHWPHFRSLQDFGSLEPLSSVSVRHGAWQLG